MFRCLVIEDVPFFMSTKTTPYDGVRVTFTDLSHCWFGTHSSESLLSTAKKLNEQDFEPSHIKEILLTKVPVDVSLGSTLMCTYDTPETLFRFEWILQVQSEDQFQEIVWLPLFKMLHIQSLQKAELIETLRLKDAELQSYKMANFTSPHVYAMRTAPFDKAEFTKYYANVETSSHDHIMAFMKTKFASRWPELKMKSREPQRAASVAPSAASVAPSAASVAPSAASVANSAASVAPITSANKENANPMEWPPDGAMDFSSIEPVGGPPNVITDCTGKTYVQLRDRPLPDEAEPEYRRRMHYFLAHARQLQREYLEDTFREGPQREGQQPARAPLASQTQPPPLTPLPSMSQLPPLTPLPSMSQLPSLTRLPTLTPVQSMPHQGMALGMPPLMPMPPQSQVDWLPPRAMKPQPLVAEMAAFSQAQKRQARSLIQMPPFNVALPQQCAMPLDTFDVDAETANEY